MNGAYAPAVDSPACFRSWAAKGRQQGVLPSLTLSLLSHSNKHKPRPTPVKALGAGLVGGRGEGTHSSFSRIMIRSKNWALRTR